jgi:hypothetical protein
MMQFSRADRTISAGQIALSTLHRISHYRFAVDAAPGAGLGRGLRAEHLAGLGQQADASGWLHGDEAARPLRYGPVAVPLVEKGSAARAACLATSAVFKWV